MSNINTSGINVNYPVPGVNNSSQGFRDNFTTIKINLDTAYNEITDLQNKVIVKSALNNSSLNNDMGNTLISNALVRSFRSTTYNLGSALSGIVAVDVSLGDVQYGTVVGDAQFQFGKWAPGGTQSNVQLVLTVTNNSRISFPNNVTASSLSTLENYTVVGNTAYIEMPSGLYSVDYCYRLSTLDCGDNIIIEPYNYPRIARQVQQRSPNPIGLPGDMNGALSVDYPIEPISITNTYSANNYLQSPSSISQLYPDLEIKLIGNSIGGLSTNTSYYVKDIDNASNSFTLALTSGGANIVLTNDNKSPGDTLLVPVQSYLYVCTSNYNGLNVTYTVSNTTVTTNIITVSSTSGMTVGTPVMFNSSSPTSTVFGGLTENIVYYVRQVISPTQFTVSRTRVNGVPGSVFPLSTASGIMNVTVYNGTDIWKRIQLTSW